MKKSKQLPLWYFTKYDILNPKNLVFIVCRSETTLTKLEKIISNILIDFKKENVDEYVIHYRYGFVTLNVDIIVNKLISEGIIRKNEKNELILTEKGLEVLKSILPELKKHRLYDEVLNEIKELYLLPTEELKMRVYRKASFLSPVSKTISGHKITYLFDWSEFGDGLTIKPYHISMLLAYAYAEKKFEEMKSKLPEYYHIGTHDINETYYFGETIKKIEKKRRILSAVTLSEVFTKKEPPHLSEDKEEGKNYIANLWMIVEAINIFHVLLGVAPSAAEIGALCLKDVLFGLESNLSGRNIKRMKERMLRNDLKKLLEYNIIEIVKNYMNTKEVRYKLTAKRYIDDNLDKEFKVLDANIIKRFYNKKNKII